MAGPLLTPRADELRKRPVQALPPCPAQHTDLLVGDRVWRCEACLRYTGNILPEVPYELS